MHQTHKFLSCTIPVLDLRRFGAGDYHDGRFLHEMLILYLASVACLDLFSLSVLDMSS